MREPFDETRNIVWQQRDAEPTDYENALGDALEEIFAAEIYDPPSIVARLNEVGFATRDGAAWTEDGFRSEMQRLGRKAFG